MPISAYSPTDSRSRLADWIELAAMTSASSSQSKGQFLRASAALEEPPFDADDEDLGYDEDDEDNGRGDRYILDERSENLANRVLAELEYRVLVLGENYPFAIRSAGSTWKLVYSPATSGAARFAQFCYLVCVLFSVIKYRYLILGATTPEYMAIAKHVQLLAFLVAPEVVGGAAYSMGWPRPDNTKTLRGALDKVSAKMKLGKLHDENPGWDRGWAKDGTVDIVAWKHYAGRTPGALVIYGQVASGLNWRSKPLRTFIDPYFTEWFAIKPTREFLHSMYIPFPVYEACKPNKSQSFERLAFDNAMRDERVYGLVIDRLRLTDMAAPRYEALTNGRDQIEVASVDGLAALFRWKRFAETLAK
ncbi:hypothetical protein [Cryobacterium sp. W22_MBD10_FK3]|uniref:hypothetical protein n=1 Tax=Cryobacterium sp. W22_MBD10_FK3 TaxID=3240273 RepID=UPI003F91D5B2